MAIVCRKLSARLATSTSKPIVSSSGDTTLAAARSGATQQADRPLEIYMEGNIVFRQGDRTFFADRMFYDVRQQLATVINGELLTSIPQRGIHQYTGLVRLRADSIRQLDQNHFLAQNGLFTTSRLEEPSYALESEEITFEDIQQPVVDPITGARRSIRRRANRWSATNAWRGTNNYVYVGGVPVFYWPTFSTNLEQPTYYVDNIKLRHDSIFGYQALVRAQCLPTPGRRSGSRGKVEPRPRLP